MNILIACEESQTVCKAFRDEGHLAFSCDVRECSGGHPEWHIKGDALKYLNPIFHESDLSYGIGFVTMDNVGHFIKRSWDIIIAHPPCTYLTVSGNRWFNTDLYGINAKHRFLKQKESINFFMSFVNADCPCIAIENPIGVMSRYYRKPDQIIHPYYFAEFENDINCESKATCLWLKGLDPLEYKIKYHPRIIKGSNGKNYPSWHYKTLGLSSDKRSCLRSKTFPGIANAMAKQWGKCPSKQLTLF